MVSNTAGTNGEAVYRLDRYGLGCWKYAAYARLRRRLSAPAIRTATPRSAISSTSTINKGSIRLTPTVAKIVPVPRTCPERAAVNRDPWTFPLRGEGFGAPYLSRRQRAGLIAAGMRGSLAGDDAMISRSTTDRFETTAAPPAFVVARDTPRLPPPQTRRHAIWSCSGASVSLISETIAAC